MRMLRILVLSSMSYGSRSAWMECVTVTMFRGSLIECFLRAFLGPLDSYSRNAVASFGQGHLILFTERIKLSWFSDSTSWRKWQRWWQGSRNRWGKVRRQVWRRRVMTVPHCLCHCLLFNPGTRWLINQGPLNHTTNLLTKNSTGLLRTSQQTPTSQPLTPVL